MRRTRSSLRPSLARVHSRCHIPHVLILFLFIFIIYSLERQLGYYLFCGWNHSLNCGTLFSPSLVLVCCVFSQQWKPWETVWENASVSPTQSWPRPNLAESWGFSEFLSLAHQCLSRRTSAFRIEIVTGCLSPQPSLLFLQVFFWEPHPPHCFLNCYL